MYIVRDIFHLKFGQYRQVKPLLDEFVKQFPSSQSRDFRVLTDFTGDSYRVIIEKSFSSLAEYEETLKLMVTPEWQTWYEKFKPHVSSSHREILKQVI